MNAVCEAGGWWQSLEAEVAVGFFTVIFAWIILMIFARLFEQDGE